MKRRDKSGTTLLDEQKRRIRALAVREELRNQEKEGKLVSRAAVEKEWFKIARQVRDALENIPARVAGLVAVEKKQEKCFAILQKEVRQALEALTK